MRPAPDREEGKLIEKSVIEKKSKRITKKEVKPVDYSISNYVYYRLQIKLIRPMLGSNPEASIYAEHVLQKAKKQIAAANKQTKKIAKSLEKYAGAEIPEEKEITELQGIIRAHQEIIGRVIDGEMPDSISELLDLARELEQEVNEKIKAGEAQKANVFMKDKDGWPMISTHMILGNIKEITRILVNNDEEILPSKTRVSETLAMDVKAVERFVRPSKDIDRKPNGERELLERPIIFERMGKKEAAIGISETLPEGTEFEFTLRIRAMSVFAKDEILRRVINYGKNIGLGPWRGSGNMGAYVFKLDLLPEYKEDFGDGWE